MTPTPETPETVPEVPAVRDREAGAVTDRCGAWGGCPLPAGHNRGRVDIPENHIEAERDHLAEQVQRVREAHLPHDCSRHFKASTPVPCARYGMCDGCTAPYPCPTRRALDHTTEGAPDVR